MKNARVAVIGGGPAGLLAACRAAMSGAQVTLFEKMAGPGRKLLLTGNGRCNLTSTLPLDSFITMYGPNGRFLYPAFQQFFREELLELMEQYGVRTRAGADGRVFPASGRASDVLDALLRRLAESGAQMKCHSPVREIAVVGGAVSGLRTGDGFFGTDAVVLAAGGSSYPATGSGGDGCRLARALGHSIVPLRPALVPLVAGEKEKSAALQGLTLADARLTALGCPPGEAWSAALPAADCGRGTGGKRPRPPVIESRRGGLLFTHYGLSGPAALLISLAAGDALASGPVTLSIDLLPGMAEGQLDDELQSALSAHGSRLLRSVLESWLPARLAAAMLEEAAIPGSQRCSRVSAAQRAALVRSVKRFRLSLAATRPLAEAMVTAGGAALTEVDPKTLQSRIVKGLYICGEVLDIDADTGGFNLQAAFSTGFLAGLSAAHPR